MNILDAVLGSHGGGAAAQLGQQFGLNDSQVSSALTALVPALAAGFQQNMSSPQGLDGLPGGPLPNGQLPASQPGAASPSWPWELPQPSWP